MLNFIKHNIDNMVKLFVNQIAMTIFGLLLSAALYSKPSLNLYGGIFTVLFYMYLLYICAWDIGARDKVKIDGKRMVRNNLKGMLISLGANAVNIVLIVILWIGLAVSGNLEVLDSTSAAVAISNNIWVLLNGMYSFICSLIPASYRALLITLSFIPALVISEAGYIAGSYNFRILSLFGIKPSKKSNGSYKR